MSEESKPDLENIFNGLWEDKDVMYMKKNADEAAKEHAPYLSRVATAVDIRCCGSLGSRSVRKQIQALLHFAMGNTKLRINANTLVPSTAALVVNATVGSGKNLYHSFFNDAVGMISDATEALDKQI